MATPRSNQSGWRVSLTRNPLALIVKTMMCAAWIVAFGASLAAPAGADPNPGGGDPNPFGGISCSCSQTAPIDSPASKQQISQGIRQGLSGQGPAS